MRTATGQDSTAGLERIQGTFTSWTVCLRDRSESRESYWHLASSVSIDEMRTATGQVSTAGLEAIHSRLLVILGLFV